MWKIALQLGFTEQGFMQSSVTSVTGLIVLNAVAEQVWNVSTNFVWKEPSEIESVPDEPQSVHAPQAGHVHFSSQSCALPSHHALHSCTSVGFSVGIFVGANVGSAVGSSLSHVYATTLQSKLVTTRLLSGHVS